VRERVDLFRDSAFVTSIAEEGGIERGRVRERRAEEREPKDTTYRPRDTHLRLRRRHFHVLVDLVLYLGLAQQLQHALLLEQGRGHRFCLLFSRGVFVSARARLYSVINLEGDRVCAV